MGTEHKSSTFIIFPFILFPFETSSLVHDQPLCSILNLYLFSPSKTIVFLTETPSLFHDKIFYSILESVHDKYIILKQHLLTLVILSLIQHPIGPHVNPSGHHSSKSNRNPRPILSIHERFMSLGNMTYKYLAI